MNSPNIKGPVVLVSKKIAFTFPLSYAYLAGYLRSNNEKVEILFKGGELNNLVRDIMALRPLVVGFGNLYPELKEIKEIIELLDNAGRDFPIVVGGQMVSPTPEFAVEITGADFGIIGEGEVVLYQLVRALREKRSSHTIKGLVYRKENKFISNGPGDYIKDLSLLPPVPYDLFPTAQWLGIGRWYAGNVPQPQWRFRDLVVNVHGGRGCPYRCNFCYHHSKPRYRSVEDMIAEATENLKRFNANVIYFSDDLVLATPKRARTLVDGIRALPQKFEYSVSARFDSLLKFDDDLLQEMKETGCRVMGLGIESGSDRMLDIIGKSVTSAQILEQLDRLKRVGILPTVSIMVGQYTETKEDVELSIDLMRKSVRNNPNIQYAFTITTPFPGSELYDIIFKNGYLKSYQEFYDRYFSTSSEWDQVVNLSAMSDEKVVEMHKKIVKAYKEEKAKALGIRVKYIRNLQSVFGQFDSLVSRVLFPNSQTLDQPGKLEKIYYSMYDGMLEKLDNYRLKLEGIL